MYTSRVSGVLTTLLSQKRNQRRKTVYSFERGMGGNVICQGVLFPCGNWAGALLARVERSLSECHLARLREG